MGTEMFGPREPGGYIFSVAVRLDDPEGNWMGLDQYKDGIVYCQPKCHHALRRARCLGHPSGWLTVQSVTEFGIFTPEPWALMGNEGARFEWHRNA